jgi:predicted aspartyl protease
LQEVEEEELEISLNAITGTFTPKTMRLYGRLKNQQVTMLIDSGSTHNLIDINLAAVLGIKPDSHESIKVRIANGQEVSSSGRSNSLPLRLQGT